MAEDYAVGGSIVRRAGAHTLPDPIVVVIPAGNYLLARPGRDEDQSVTGDLDLRKRIAVIGAGATVTRIDGGGHDRVFDVQAASIARLAGFRITYADREETLRAGDVYYMPAGHTGVAEEDTEFLEVAPPEQHQQFVENALRNLAAAQPG